LFPRIIDTKYLATHAEGDLNASPTLQDIAESLSTQPLPDIITHADHPKYQEAEAFHEAGYDSLLTATIMIRLAAKLGAERGEQIPAPLPHHSRNKANGISPEEIQDFVKDGREKVEHPVPLPPVEEPQPKKTKNQKSKAKKKEAKQRRFETKNLFDTLKALSPEAEASSTEEDEEAKLHDPSGPVKWDGQGQEVAGSWENDVYVEDNTAWVPLEQLKRQPMELIPAFDSKFWNDFGNTLRVFGTEEAVLKIADWEI
jgi:poly(A)-specific ribonuclease